MLGGGGTGTTARNYIGQLNPGRLTRHDLNPGANAIPHVLAVQADGKILVGGEFTTLGGGGAGTTPRSKVCEAQRGRLGRSELQSRRERRCHRIGGGARVGQS